MYKILLNKRYSKNSPYFKDSTRKQLSILLQQYLGFEGECQQFTECNDLREAKIQIEKYRKEIDFSTRIEFAILICIEIDKKEKSIKLDNCSLVGYDYGILLDKYELYSSVLQEILFGHIDELMLFKDQLNNNYLFSTFEKAEQFAQKHHQLLLEGKDVEIEDDMKIYQIWKIEL
jgi:hypothetical protein